MGGGCRIQAASFLRLDNLAGAQQIRDNFRNFHVVLCRHRSQSVPDKIYR